MLYVICTNVVEKKNLAAFLNAAKAHAKKSQDIDKGCISFDVSKYYENANEVMFVEKWASREDLDVHLKRCASEPLIKEIVSKRVDKGMKIVEID